MNSEKELNLSYKIIKDCEVCGSKELIPVLDFGLQPLCDDLHKIGLNPKIYRHPQEILYCMICKTAHQKYQIPKEVLFKENYHYRASLTKDVVDGMKDFVAEVLKISPAASGSTVLDIGCNDGSLLKIFAKSGFFTVGIDPTDAIIGQEQNIHHPIKGYFDSLNTKFLKDKYDTFDYITLTNVFAHIENLDELCSNLKTLIGPKTILAIENHYLGSVVSKNQFDTFYHEHPRTYSIKSFEFIARKLGMSIKSVSKPSRYGGNIRVILSRDDEIPDASSHTDEEFIKDGLEKMQKTFKVWTKDTRDQIMQLCSSGPILGKSLPGRAVMLINSLGLSEKEMPYIFEKPKSPKIGNLVPNTKIQILSDDDLLQYNYENIVIWSWHIQNEIYSYLREIGFKNKIWTVLPSFQLLD